MGTTTSNYYFYDFSQNGFNLRIIVLDQYEIDSGVPEIMYGIVHSQEQIDWLLNILESSINKDGVIVSMHSGFGNTLRPRDITHTGDFISTKVYGYAESYEYWVYSDLYMIPDIIKSYMTGENFEKTFPSGILEDRLNVKTSFKEPANNFIGYNGGHTHWDVVKYLREFPEQLQIIVADGGTAGSKRNDLPRADKPYTINYYIYLWI